MSSCIEHLPEPLVAHVLGYLPTKEAVRTSVLASEWKHLWTSIENLNFDDDIPSLDMANIVMLQLKFTLLHKFRLKFSKHHQIPIINNLIDASLSRCIKELDLHINWAKTRSLAYGIFKSNTLAVLKLRVHTLDVPVLVHLPNLKVLHVEDTKFKDDKSICRLFTSCPLLEELALISCGFKDQFVLEISNPALKKLVLNRNVYYKVKYSIVLDTPKLAYFKFADYIPQGFTVKNLDSLVGASVDFNTYRGGLSPSNFVITKSATEFVHALSNVQSLHLFSEFTRAFIRLRIKFLVFPELTKLEYGIDDIPACCLLQDLIECSPKLESIVLNFNNRFVPHEYIPASVWDGLKVVKRTLFTGNTEDLQFAKYILRNAKVLERLHLYSSAELYEVSTNEYKNVEKSAAELDEESTEDKNPTKKLFTLRRTLNVKNFYRNIKLSKKLDRHSKKLYEESSDEYEKTIKSEELDEVSRKLCKDATKELMTFQRASKLCKIVVHSM